MKAVGQLARYANFDTSGHSYGYGLQSSPAPSCICPAPFSGILVKYAGVRPESCMLSKWVKGPPLKPGRERVTESCERVSNDGFEA
jgi:hypothetical protein